MTSDKQNYEPETNGKHSGEDLDKYVRLRTVLDSLEIGAIKYLLDKSEGKGERFGELNEKLMPIVQWLWKRDIAIECPQGYVDCHGACVPYPCPDPGGD